MALTITLLLVCVDLNPKHSQVCVDAGHIHVVCVAVNPKHSCISLCSLSLSLYICVYVCIDVAMFI